MLEKSVLAFLDGGSRLIYPQHSIPSHGTTVPLLDVG